MKKLILLVTVCFSISSFALIAGPTIVEGKVKSFDNKIVVVESSEASFEVPRDFVAQKNFKPGEKIEILLSLEQSEKVKIQKIKVEKK